MLLSAPRNSGMVSSRVIYTQNLSIGFHGGDGTINVSFSPQPLTLNRTYSAKATTQYNKAMFSFQNFLRFLVTSIFWTHT